MENKYLNIHQNIQTWYKRYGRHHLPWRRTNDPYHIYLSEVMLQQTQVKTVLERYYYPFLGKFPTLKSLADASLDDVLKMWEGLGYYNRAKNLHKTARLIDIVPSEIEELIKLPGIGENTAHAIAAFAYKKPVPVMEANVKRILCRLNALSDPTTKELWQIAYKLVDKQKPYEYNQAMMDIGATLCTPKNPTCVNCPFVKICRGKESPAIYPSKKKRIIPQKEQFIVLKRYNKKLALSQREGKFLHGLWGFLESKKPLSGSKYIGIITHVYTHFKLSCKVYMYDEAHKSENDYFSIEEIQRLAISKVDEKIVKLYLDTIQTY